VGSQLSRPYQIALVAAVGLFVLWFVALRPKGDSSSSWSSSTPSAPQTSYRKAVDKAKGAAAASNAANQRLQQATGEKADAPARPAPSAARPVPDARRPTPDARPATAAPRVLVLLFWNTRAADDRAVHSALARLDRHHGRVAVAAAPIEDVGRYKAITSSVNVLESPTVIVLDTRTRRARTIAGYADVGELDHAVAQTLAG
jgi:hypothetical protein